MFDFVRKHNVAENRALLELKAPAAGFFHHDIRAGDICGPVVW